MMMSRPSPKEINSKIKQAKKALLENRISIINPMNAGADALELGINIQRIANILIDLLKEITPNDYAGQYPPQRSYESGIKDCELLAFQWLSKKLGCRVYLKFTIKENQLWLVSLHQARKIREEE
jgi:hypothetical protein